MRHVVIFLLFLSFAVFQSFQTTAPQPQKKAPTRSVFAGEIFFQSPDGGKNWFDLSQSLPENFKPNCLFAQNGEVFLGGDDGIIYHSTNPEMGFWERDDVVFISMTEKITGVPLANEARVTSITSGPSGIFATIYENGFFRRKTGSKTWQRMPTPLNQTRIYSVVEMTDGSILTTSDKGVFKTTDDGKTWNSIFSEGRVSGLEASGNTLLVCNANGVERSDDGGQTWHSSLPDKGGIYNFHATTDGFLAIRAAGRWNADDGEAQHRLFRSTDDGKTWQRLDENFWIRKEFSACAQVGESIFCSRVDGVFRSNDGGKTWELVRPAAKNDEMLQFSVSGKTLFAIQAYGC